MTPLIDRIADHARLRPSAPAYTFIDFLGDGEPRVCTWGEVHERSIRLAQRLRRFVVPGERVAILAPSGLAYVLGLIASWYTGAIAVPLFAPGLPGHAERLAASFADCDPSAAVTVAACAADVRAFVGGSTKIIIADESGAADDEDTGWR